MNISKGCREPKFGRRRKILIHTHLGLPQRDKIVVMYTPARTLGSRNKIFKRLGGTETSRVKLPHPPPRSSSPGSVLLVHKFSRRAIIQTITVSKKRVRIQFSGGGHMN